MSHSLQHARTHTEAVGYYFIGTLRSISGELFLRASDVMADAAIEPAHLTFDVLNSRRDLGEF